MKKRELVLTVLKAVFAMTLFFIAVCNYDKLSNLNVGELVSFTADPYLIAAVVLVIYAVKALVFVIPASLVYVAVGVIMPGVMNTELWFAFLTAVLLNLLGIFLEVSVTYWLGRFLGKDAVQKLLSKKEAGRKILDKNLGDKAGALLVIRAVPAFPIDFISLFYGASGCKYLKYALLSTLGISWRVILFTVLGDAAFAWIPVDKIILIIICCIPVGVGYYLVKKFVLDPKKKKKNETGAQQENNETKAE